MLGLWHRGPHMTVSEFCFVGQETFLTKENKKCPACTPSSYKSGSSQPDLGQARIHTPVKPMAHFPLTVLPGELGVLIGHTFNVSHFCIQLFIWPSPGRGCWAVLILRHVILWMGNSSCSTTSCIVCSYIFFLEKSHFN